MLFNIIQNDYKINKLPMSYFLLLSSSKNKNVILIKNKTLHNRTYKVHKNKVQN